MKLIMTLLLVAAIAFVAVGQEMEQFWKFEIGNLWYTTFDVSDLALRLGVPYHGEERAVDLVSIFNAIVDRIEMLEQTEENEALESLFATPGPHVAKETTVLLPAGPVSSSFGDEQIEVESWRPDPIAVFIIGAVFGTAISLLLL